ncbi:hypothetical protein Tco_1029515 [Tanacetum coccineum]|uniref:Uncharacterized protein n=1 Tax=Tanacetum coccineum TaxID=301880 RepID=A0ABQ5G480_9ASTR
MLFLITITPRRFDSRQSDYTCNRPIGEATLVPPLDPSPSSTTNKVEVPKEFPKVSMVNTSLKELKRHLAGFDQVVKERTTATAITEGHRGGFEPESQENDTVIVKLKEQIKSLKGNVDDSKVKMDMDEIETLNIELEHRVTKLVAERVRLSTSASGSQPSGNTRNDKIQQTPSSNSKNN